MKELIAVKEMSKFYGEKKVVDKLSFGIREGEILCLLGPNGAGKSTTINILCGLLDYNGGELKWNGKCMEDCLNQYKRKLGVVPQDLAIYEDMSAEKNVKFFASLYGFRGQSLKMATEEALKFVGLLERKNDKAGTFSGGMKRRLNIACAIAHKPELLIMDEPTVGIDPQSRNHILESIRTLQKEGMTILYTTHYMEEVEEISDRILIMDSGKLIAEGTKESLQEAIFHEREFIMEVESTESFNEKPFYSIDGVKKVECLQNKVTIDSLQNVENLDQIIIAAMKQDMKINNLFCREANLESVFLKLTGKSLRD